TPHGQTAANHQTTLSDGTGYWVTGRVHNNSTAANALDALKDDGVFFVFGHGGWINGGSPESYQTFWDGANWHYLVQTTIGKNRLSARGVPANNIVCLDEQTVTVNNQQVPLSLQHVLLAVFEGCWTAYGGTDWGSPVDGVVARGAACALGF